MRDMSHASFLSKLGTVEEVASQLAKLSGEPVTAHAMSNWGVRGIPRYLRVFAVRLAEQNGVSIPKDLKRYASVPAAAE